MIDEPKVKVFCDRENCYSGDDYYEEYELTALVRNSWDLRNLNADLEADGWKIEGEDTHVCPDCVIEDEIENDEEEYPDKYIGCDLEGGAEDE